MKVSPDTLPGCALAPTRALVTRLAALTLASTSPQRLRISSDGDDEPAPGPWAGRTAALFAACAAERVCAADPAVAGPAAAAERAETLPAWAAERAAGALEAALAALGPAGTLGVPGTLPGTLGAAGALGATGTFMPLPPPAPGPLGVSASTGIAIFARCKAARAASRPEPSGARPKPTEARPAPS